MRIADLDKSSLEIEGFFVDRPGTACSQIFQPALELHENAKVLSQMPIRVQHVPLEKKRVHVCLLSPVIISDLLESFTDFAAETDVARLAVQRDVLDRIPEVGA